ncbi:uncharacterized protein LOC101237116 [Hydra vulgaris]|uniref:uncharacterized protein LOC101237116 n=1 Tax=Hydra vulgaris TaxID=6087 RepID=UPI000640EB4B|nr:uncharacterized protein LOC101237116 [Hydra vulgaris]
MKVSRVTAQRILSLVLILLAISLTSTALLTNYWHEEVSKSKKVLFHRGLWVECHVYLHNSSQQNLKNKSIYDTSPKSLTFDKTQVLLKRICQKIEILPRNVVIVRGLLAVCIFVLSFGVLAPLILSPFKRRLNMNITSATSFVAIILKVGALALYYDDNPVHADLNFHYTLGYSYMLAWLSFSLIIFATTLSILSRKEEGHIQIQFSKCETLSCSSLRLNECDQVISMRTL